METCMAWNSACVGTQLRAAGETSAGRCSPGLACMMSLLEAGDEGRGADKGWGRG